jgi:hypothetical protein
MPPQCWLRVVKVDCFSVQNQPPESCHIPLRMTIQAILPVFGLLVLLPPAATAQTADEAAIRLVIESESKAYHTNPDRTAYLGYWLLNENTRLVYTGAEGTFYVTGSMMQSSLSSGKLPPMDHAVTEYSNYVIRADGKIGWASFDQISRMPDGQVKYMHEFRCMEKVQGTWKTVQSSIHSYTPK